MNNVNFNVFLNYMKEVCIIVKKWNGGEDRPLDDY